MTSSNRKLASLTLAGVVFTTAAQALAAPPAPPPAPAPAPTVHQGETPPARNGQLDPVFKADESVLSGALALGGMSGAVGDTAVPPLVLGFDKGIHPDISAGAFASYAKSTYKYGYPYAGAGISYSYFSFGGRGSFHFGKYLPVEKLDLYGGLMLAYSVVSVSGPTGTVASSGNMALWGLHLGGRYFFTPSLAAQMELGVGLGNLSIGLAYKL